MKVTREDQGNEDIVHRTYGYHMELLEQWHHWGFRDLIVC